MKIVYSNSKDLPEDQVLALYNKLNWSSAKKPKLLIDALKGSHTVISAWIDDQLIGLGNAISDGALVVYYPHLLVDPDYQGRGVGKAIVERMKKRYEQFHQQQIVADGKAIEFYQRCGFEFSGKCKAMWIYDGHDHD